MTRSPSLSAAIHRLRDQVKIEAAVLLDAARGAAKHVRGAFADLAADRESEKRYAESMAEHELAMVRLRTDRLYMAAMSQASQPVVGHSEDPRCRRWRLQTLAVKSLHDGDQAMRLAGLQPESHPRRAMAVRRMRERGIVAE